jgi:hypothetical protein
VERRVEVTRLRLQIVARGLPAADEVIVGFGRHLECVDQETRACDEVSTSTSSSFNTVTRHHARRRIRVSLSVETSDLRTPRGSRTRTLA